MDSSDDRDPRQPAVPDFVPGLDLGARFFAEAVAPILADAFPSLRYSAALIGSGSEVLGYDTARSTDHEWGPRLLLFVAEADHAAHAPRIRAALSHRLPPTFRGYPTHFGPPDAEGIRATEARAAGPVDHKVEVHTARRFFAELLGVDPRDGLDVRDWLTIPQQKLLEATAGRVYHDGLGELATIRATLAFYPRDVWLYLLASQWRRIAQQEAFVGRAGEVGDDLGSALVAASLVRDLMGLCFLMERRYAPYSKWLGTAFSRLTAASELGPHLRQVLRAARWAEREAHLCAAYEAVARRHNGLGATAPVEARASPFHNRPFRVIHGDRFAAALVDAIEDAEVNDLVRRVGLIGSVDQVSDSVDVLAHPRRYAKLRALYDEAPSDV